MKMAHYKFTVEALHSIGFPIDMLRYDGCFPDTSEDSVLISYQHPKKGASVTLRKVGTVHWTPTTERWRSFGWNIVPGSVRRTD